MATGGESGTENWGIFFARWANIALQLVPLRNAAENAGVEI